MVGRGGSCILNMQCSSAFQNEADLISLDFSEASDMLGEETKKRKKEKGEKKEEERDQTDLINVKSFFEELLLSLNSEHFKYRLVGVRGSAESLIWGSVGFNWGFSSYLTNVTVK